MIKPQAKFLLRYFYIIWQSHVDEFFGYFNVPYKIIAYIPAITKYL